MNAQEISDRNKEEGYLNLFVGHDVKADIYMAPISFAGIEAINQYLAVLVNTHGNGHYHLYPEDYVFYLIGHFDVETGKTVIYNEKYFAINLAGLKEECPHCKEFTNESEQVQQCSASEDPA